MKSFTRFIYEAVSSQTVANPNPKDDNEADGRKGEEKEE